MRRSIVTFCLSLLLFACAIQSARAEDSNNAIAAMLTGGRHPYLHDGNLSAEREVLQQLYQQRNFTPLWFEQEQVTRPALALLTLLRNAAGYGLRAADYDGIELTSRLAQLDGAAPDTRAALDVGLSTAALRFIRHLHYGRIDPRQAGFNIDVMRNRELDAAAVLAQLAGTEDAATIIAALEPQFVHYQLLKHALARYRLLAVDPDLTELPIFAGRSIRPGEQYAGAPALRRLLVAEQDLSGEASAGDSDTSLDAGLVKGLQSYQARHGLPADGVLGKRTFAALTTPFAQRVAQIELTLERWRWLPPLQSPMIIVNIPQYRLFAFNTADDREANLLAMDVIVGQTYPHTRTPIFLADMKFVVFRPYWDVPYSITQREILPGIRRQPNYLERNHFELVRGQGDNSPVVPASADNIAQLASGAIRVRQLPGNDNALGDIKFMLPNRYNVYLHSTPAKRLFSESRRAFSHGCIRVGDPLALADYVLRNAAEGWDGEKIEAAMQGAPNQRVYLNRPIPVLIVYNTVMPRESGVVQFFDDIYGHDARLAQLL